MLRQELAVLDLGADKRARAYLLTDEVVEAAATYYAHSPAAR
jgi:hypothetical protein